MDWNWETFWRILPVILPIITTILAWLHQRVKMPKALADLLANKWVMQSVNGVVAAVEMQYTGESAAKKQEAARKALQVLLQQEVGQLLSANTINTLIEMSLAAKRITVAAEVA